MLMGFTPPTLRYDNAKIICRFRGRTFRGEMQTLPSGAKLAEHLAEALHSVRKGKVMVVTGAGVSCASGIPTFRGEDPDAVWRRDVTELGTYAYFLEDPAGSWSWYLKRFESLDTARPNPAHHALVALEQWQQREGGEMLLVTQNIDTLHEQAGSKNLIKVHGSSDRVRCPRLGCRHSAPSGSLLRSQFDFDMFRVDSRRLHLPKCPECGTLLRQHVLWFDESYGDHADYQIERILLEAGRMHLLIFIGTSFSVGITELLLQRAGSRGVKTLSIDPSESTNLASWHRVHALPAAAEILLPEVCERLGIHLEAEET